ncbi:hypothetical protein NIES4075_44460 [Tolypothrix sp. NIES-4075]|nr:hypothetical protein NIES4075_44460 [Tolypothrix sp. NIES-4075]
MKIKLLTQFGDFVRDTEILPFNEYPAVMIWGDRDWCLQLYLDASRIFDENTKNKCWFFRGIEGDLVDRPLIFGIKSYLICSKMLIVLKCYVLYFAFSLFIIFPA